MTTNSELAILSLLAERPRHGYEIEQVIEQRGMRNWTEIGFSSIYYVLNKLEKAGMIFSRMQSSSGKGPTRKVYDLTKTGRGAWQDAALAALSQPEPCHLPIQIGLSNLPLLPKEQTLTALRVYLDTLVETKKSLNMRQANLGAPMPYQVNAMFGLSLTMIEAEINWLQSFLSDYTMDNTDQL